MSIIPSPPNFLCIFRHSVLQTFLVATDRRKKVPGSSRMLVCPQSQRTFKADHNDGKDGERKSYNALKSLTKNPLTHILDIIAPWDFESATTLIEHKDRNCFYKSYKETMIKGLKVQRARLSDKRCFFAFRFLDGLYYIRYKKELFDTFRTDIKKIADRTDYQEKEELRVYIPIHLLTCLEKFEVPALFLDD